MDEDAALERLATARVARMATVDPSGAPHVVPVTFAVDGRTLYWAVDRKPKRSDRLKRVENIRANPHVQVVADHYDEDWTALWWVRASGCARIVDDQAERNRALDLLREKYPQYRLGPPEGDVVAVALRRLVGWQAAAR